MRADRASSTARLIARSLLLCGDHPRLRLLTEATDTPLLQAALDSDGPSGDWFGAAMRHATARKALHACERALLPGIFCHYLARKRCIQEQVLSRLQAGCRQIVVLGAGFDPLAWRLHRSWPRVRFWELDHPATQRAKRAAVNRAGAGANLQLLPVDLGREAPSSALRSAAGYRFDEDTGFVLEGVLMYFPVTRVAELLTDLATHSTAHLVFTFMIPDADGRPRFRGANTLVDLWLRAISEPFAWGSTAENLPSFLSAHGWTARETVGTAGLRERILMPAGLHDLPLAVGECLHFAARP